MTLWIIAPLVIAAIGAVCMGLGLPRGRRDDDRRCPACGYDLAGSTTPPCPECGHHWSGSMIQRVPPRPRRMAIGLLLLAIGLYAAMPGVTGRHWTHFVPRFVVDAALRMTVPRPAPAAGGMLPSPTASNTSLDRWQRLVWHREASMAIDHFVTLVTESDGSLAAVERLLPAGQEANAIYLTYGASRSTESWQVQRARDRLWRVHASIDAQSTVPIGTWAAFELQFLMGSGNMYPDFIRPPAEIFGALAVSEDPAVREYVISRLAVSDSVEAGAILDEMIERETDPALQSRATDAQRWRRTLHGWP